MPARRLAGPIALLAALAPIATTAWAQSPLYAGSIDLASENRYRGAGLGRHGPVARASVSVDAPAELLEGAYAGVSGTWHAAGGGLQTAEALLGWSRRFNEWPAMSKVDARWGWDAGIHQLHYGDRSRLDFHEFMLGVLSPFGTLRAWWSPHYFGGPLTSTYLEADRSIDLPAGWRLFAHAGLLRYGREGSQPRLSDHVDGRFGVGCSTGRWDWRFAFDGRTALGRRAPFETRRSESAWVVSGGVAF